MYVIVNKSTGSHEVHEGSFPCLDEYYKNKHWFYVISLYSMTVKIPIVENEHDFLGYGTTINDPIYKSSYYPDVGYTFEVVFNEFPLPEYLIKEEYLINKGK